MDRPLKPALFTPRQYSNKLLNEKHLSIHFHGTVESSRLDQSTCHKFILSVKRLKTTHERPLHTQFYTESKIKIECQK